MFHCRNWTCEQQSKKLSYILHLFDDCETESEIWDFHNNECQHCCWRKWSSALDGCPVDARKRSSFPLHSWPNANLKIYERLVTVWNCGSDGPSFAFITEISFTSQKPFLITVAHLIIRITISVCWCQTLPLHTCWGTS